MPVCRVETKKCRARCAAECRIWTARRSASWWPSSGTRCSGLYVTPTFDDAAIDYAHHIDATHRVAGACAPPIAPEDEGMVAQDTNLFLFEGTRAIGGDALPEFEARLTADVARAVRGGLVVLEDAVLGKKVIQQRWVVALECLIEAFPSGLAYWGMKSSPRSPIVISALPLAKSHHTSRPAVGKAALQFEANLAKVLLGLP